MSFEQFKDEHDPSTRKRIERLESYHRGGYGLLLTVLLAALIGFVYWSMEFTIDQVARASGEVIASSRVQVIQAVDGGVISELSVSEGDRVEPGQMLARLDQTRVGASVGEVGARLHALRAKAIRLRAEATGGKQLTFPQQLQREYPDQVAVELALFEQRQIGLNEELRTLRVALRLARKELGMIEELLESGDVSGAERLRAQRAVNEAEAKLINRKNRFLEEAQAELSKAEDEIAQNTQVLTRRQQEKNDSVFYAQVAGIVKNIRVTTVGGVLRAGEELLQIVPVDDELIIEAKVSPADIAQLRPGLDASLRFNAFDYTIHGNVPGKVIYISADTLKEDSGRGEEIYYRVHVATMSNPVTTTTGKQLDILPGMTAEVDIRIGQRTVLDYLLKPVRKTLTESLGGALVPKRENFNPTVECILCTTCLLI